MVCANYIFIIISNSQILVFRNIFRLENYRNLHSYRIQYIALLVLLVYYWKLFDYWIHGWFLVWKILLTSEWYLFLEIFIYWDKKFIFFSYNNKFSFCRISQTALNTSQQLLEFFMVSWMGISEFEIKWAKNKWFVEYRFKFEFFIASGKS
jgi:hypothetical protein